MIRTQRVALSSRYSIFTWFCFYSQCPRRCDPQALNTKGLENLGDEWLEENPYEGNSVAIEIGASGYNQNCARCHGLQVISGGIAPDLRYLPLGLEGDEWYMMRVRNGYSQNGAYKMPPFENILSQEAMWAIRSFIVSKHEEE